MKYIQTFEGFLNESVVDPMDHKALQKLFMGHPATIETGDADGRDYNKFVKVSTANMTDDVKNKIIKSIQSLKFDGVAKNNVDAKPNNGGGITLVVKYFDDEDMF